MADTDDSRTSTVANSGPVRGRPFTKGDKRINRQGRPSDFNAWRELGKAILGEAAHTKDGAQVIAGGHACTNAEAVLRSWLASGEFRKQMAVCEIAYGKVPDAVNVAGADGGPLLPDMKAFEAALAKAYGPDYTDTEKG